MLQTEHNLGYVKLNLFKRKSTLILHMVKKLSSGHKVHHKVYSILALKYEVHRHQERVIYLKHYESL